MSDHAWGYCTLPVGHDGPCKAAAPPRGTAHDTLGQECKGDPVKLRDIADRCARRNMLDSAEVLRMLASRYELVLADYAASLAQLRTALGAAAPPDAVRQAIFAVTDCGNRDASYMIVCRGCAATAAIDALRAVGIASHMPSRERLREMIAAAPDLDCEAGAAAPPDAPPADCDDCGTCSDCTHRSAYEHGYQDGRAAAPSRPEGERLSEVKVLASDLLATYESELPSVDRWSMLLRLAERLYARGVRAASAPEREP